MRRKRKKKQSKLGLGLVAFVLLLLGIIPVSIVFYQTNKSGLTTSQFLQRMVASSSAPPMEISNNALPKGERIDFLISSPLGSGFTTFPKISNVETVDLDGDGLLDVVVCDCEANYVSWIRQHPQGVFSESVLAADLIAPAHAEAVDFDADGDLDLLVAVLGMLFPNNDRIGSVVILENDGNMNMGQHVVIERVARVSDVRSGDLDGDGDLDLAVTQFGYDDGETRWLENLGGWNFESHMLQSLAGGIHCPVADVDGDGNLDITVLVSQESEEIYIFSGNGAGQFKTRRIYGADNPDYGSSGIWLHDLDRDGDLDILYTNGDAFDYLPPSPRSWHGIQWLENLGEFEFAFHRIFDFGGVVGARPIDVDHDGDLDIIAVSVFNEWSSPDSQSMMWLENDGSQRFRPRDLADTPTHIQTLAPGDFDQDGDVDFVTGGMHVYAPFDRVERVVLWENQWREVSGSE